MVARIAPPGAPPTARAGCPLSFGELHHHDRVEVVPEGLLESSRLLFWQLRYTLMVGARTARAQLPAKQLFLTGLLY